MNHLEGYKSKKFDNGKRMFTKMLLLLSIVKMKRSIYTLSVVKLKGLREYIREFSIFT